MDLTGRARRWMTSLRPSDGKVSAPPEVIEVDFSLKTVPRAFSTLQLMAAPLSFKTRQLWMLRTALRAVIHDQQHHPDWPGVERKLRRVLVFHHRIRKPHIDIGPKFDDGRPIGCDLRIAMAPAPAEPA